MKLTPFLLFFLLLCTPHLLAQTALTLERTLVWDERPSTYTQTDGENWEYWKFKGCGYAATAPSLPQFSERFLLPGKSAVSVEVVSVEYEPFAKKTGPHDAAIGETIQFKALVAQERRRHYGRLQFVPIRRTGSGFERVKSFSVRLIFNPPQQDVAPRGGPFTSTSALSTGSIYKFGVAQSGIYKLDYNFLKNELGISNLDNIDPRTIRLLGNGGAMLPEKNNAPRPDDLTENAIALVGEQDGRFNTGDYILFYAVGPAPWFYRPDPSNPQLTVSGHLYDKHAWYFIKTGDGNGLRVQEQPSVPATFLSEEFDDFRRLEKETVNLLDAESESAQGTGKRWFGDNFDQTREREYEFEFPNLVAGANIRVRAEFAGRSSERQKVRLIAGNTTVTRDISTVNISSNEATFAQPVALNGVFQSDQDKFKIKIQYPAVEQNSEGWLDYIELNARRRLIMGDKTLEFRDLLSLTQTATRYRISGVTNNPLSIWDITNPQNPRLQQKTQSGAAVEFGAGSEGVLKNFVAFYDNAAFPKPEQAVKGKLANQNLHGLSKVQMAIVYPAELEAPARQLAEHRKNFSRLSVALVEVGQLYNEFSSGAKDPTALRDFARMLLERSPDDFEFMLLLGDGSFDPKNNNNAENNKDLIPVFETEESFHPVDGFPSDDYFALLSPEEGGDLEGALDIAVGRIPARSVAEAQAVVDKIIAYENKPETLGDWQLRALYLADDEDSNQHLNQADKLANENTAVENWFNVEKIYFDAYQQVATSGGERFPDAKSAINANIFKGTLVVQYVGHGGPRGWAQERVTDLNDIAGWDNPNRYPLIITATCSFGGYDDYKILTGGEQALLKEKGGAVSLFTTVRAVFIFGNEQLTDAVQARLFQRTRGRYSSIGQVLVAAKNTISFDPANARRFTLLGDPALVLAMPEYRVQTESINGRPVDAARPDTLRALQTVEVAGRVTDTLGNVLNGFNGRVFVTVFDKIQTLRTLGQDDGSIVRPFSVQRNAIFKGSATVTNGRFKVNFVVPKDINYSFGRGKISYYAENGTPLNGAGGDNNLIVGGNANQVKDDTPPLIQPFLNTESFAFGGITDEDPKVLVRCIDDMGMNVSGASLGHDLTAVLDGNVLETITLNDFYQSAQDNPKEGRAVYPLQNLTPGRHTLKVKGWDVANNSGEGYTEFFVAENGKNALDHVLNYPNPFTTNTWFQFEHNLAGQTLDVQVSIFSVSGKLVKTLLKTIQADGYRVSNEIPWDGRDEYGDPLGRGVYLYRVKVRGAGADGQANTVESGFEKLVLIK